MVNQKEFAQNRYVLTDYVYRNKNCFECNGIVLGKVSSICRPAPLSAKQLDDIHTVSETDCCYLRVSDIQDGIIDVAILPNILHIEGKYKKYILQKGDVIISKSGRPFKIAVYDSSHNKKVLPVGNMYVIRPDQSQVNPYYIKACLERTKGTAMLESLLTGGAVQIITVEGLKSVRIPNVVIESQNRMEEDYTYLLFKINEKRTELKQLIDSVSYYLEEL